MREIIQSICILKQCMINHQIWSTNCPINVHNSTVWVEGQKTYEKKYI